MFHRVKLAVFAGIAVAAVTMSATSAETPRVRAYSVKVNFSDLDLTREDDARELLGRLEHAAFTVCGGYSSSRTYSGRVAQAFSECRDDALSRAVATVDAQQLWQAFGAAPRLAHAP